MYIVFQGNNVYSELYVLNYNDTYSIYSFLQFIFRYFSNYLKYEKLNMYFFYFPLLTMNIYMNISPELVIYHIILIFFKNNTIETIIA